MTKFKSSEGYQPPVEEQERIDYVNSLTDTPIYEAITDKQYNSEKLAQAILYVLVKNNIISHEEVIQAFDTICKHDLINDLDGKMNDFM